MSTLDLRKYFPRRSNVGFLIVGFVQLVAAALIFVRLRHSPSQFRARSLVLVVVAFITGVDLFIAVWHLSGGDFPVFVANLGPIELAVAVIAIVYCVFSKPTRLSLLLYTVTFVAGVHAMALTLVFLGNFSGAVPSPDFSPFLSAAKTLSVLELVASIIYPLYFVVKGRYARQFITVGS